MTNRLNRVLAAVIVCSLIAAGWVTIQRIQVENAYKRMSYAIPYTDLKRLAVAQGVSVGQAFAPFKQAGINAVLYKEPCLADLADEGQVYVTNAQGMLALGRVWYNESHRYGQNATYIITSNRELGQQIGRQLSHKLGKDKVGLAELPVDDIPMQVITVDQTPRDLAAIGLGFIPSEVKAMEAAGAHSLFMLKDWPNVDAESIRFVFDELRRTSQDINAVMFEKKQVLGFPKYLDVVADELKKTGTNLGQIEFYEQNGLTQLALLADKRVVRMHSVTDNEMATIGVSTLIDRMTLAARERNMRILYLKFLPAANAKTSADINTYYMSRIIKRLEQEGFTGGWGPGRGATTLPPTPVSRGLLFIIGLGPIAGGLLLLSRLGWHRWRSVLGVMALAAWAGLLWVEPTFARKLMALASVVVFPTLSVLYWVPEKGLSPWQAVVRLGLMTLVSLIGALLMAGLLTDTSFMLKLNQFMGVKAAHVLPIALLAVAFFLLYGKGTVRQRLESVLNQPILVKYLVILAFLGILLLVYVSRTGNEASVGVSSYELQLRALLDKILGVRPRTKEFLIGHPFMLLLLYLGYRSHALMPLLVIGSIGQVSLVNTFAHIHTPFLISLIRTANGLILGTVAGLILIAVVHVGKRLEGWWRRV